jgi:hypothetical protein
LWFRLGCTSVLQHLGGIHSGCAVSGLIWLLYHVINLFRSMHSINDSVLVMGVITNFVVAAAALSAFPWIRNNHHNVFERNHRAFGWTGIIVTWAFTILGDIWDSKTRTWNLSGVHLIKQQDFWYIMLMTTL